MSVSFLPKNANKELVTETCTLNCSVDNSGEMTCNDPLKLDSIFESKEVAVISQPTGDAKHCYDAEYLKQWAIGKGRTSATDFSDPLTRASIRIPEGWPTAPSEPTSEAENRPAEPVDASSQTQIPRPGMILFHTNWCEHCKSFMPVWRQLCDKKEKDHMNLYNLYEIDCSAPQSNAEKQKHYRVKSYPTIIWQKAGDGSEAAWVKYSGPRGCSDITKYIFENLNSMWTKPCRDQKISRKYSVGDIRSYINRVLLESDQEMGYF